MRLTPTAPKQPQIPKTESCGRDRKGLQNEEGTPGGFYQGGTGEGKSLERWRGLGRSRPLRDSPSIRAQNSSAGPEENCAASAQGRLAGRSRRPQQNSNFPFISAASLAILKGRRSAVGSQANWIWASSSRVREGQPDGGGEAQGSSLGPV